jgi:hypothetical protein
MHEVTKFAALGDREPCVCTSDVSDDASVVQWIFSFPPFVRRQSFPVARLYY